MAITTAKLQASDKRQAAILRSHRRELEQLLTAHNQVADEVASIEAFRSEGGIDCLRFTVYRTENGAHIAGANGEALTDVVEMPQSGPLPRWWKPER